MASVLVIGGLDFSVPVQEQFVKKLGWEIVSQGHKLLNGCRSAFDARVAEGANEAASELGLAASQLILSYVDPQTLPAHDFGTILKSRCSNWTSLASPGLEIPETIQEADVVIVVGGREGTNCAANWARIGRKVVMPITLFGGAANDIYYEELDDFNERYAQKISRSDYEILNQISSDFAKVAKDSVALAARAISSKYVFVVMSFSDNPALADAYDSFQEMCSSFSYVAERIDNANAKDRIIQEIFERIRRSAFVIVDLTEARPNVYYELGLAQGMNKPVIVTAQKGTELPFDVADIPTVLWDSQKELKEKLKERIALIAPAHGRGR